MVEFLICATPDAEDVCRFGTTGQCLLLLSRRVVLRKAYQHYCDQRQFNLGVTAFFRSYSDTGVAGANSVEAGRASDYRRGVTKYSPFRDFKTGSDIIRLAVMQ